MNVLKGLAGLHPLDFGLCRGPVVQGTEAALRTFLHLSEFRRWRRPLRQLDVHVPQAGVVAGLEARKGCQQPRQHGYIGM